MHIFNCEAHDISEDIYLQKLPQSFFVNLRFLFTFDNQIQLSKQRGTYFESAENTGLYLTILEPDTLTTVRLSSPMLFSYGGCHYLTCALYHKILNSKLNLYYMIRNDIHKYFTTNVAYIKNRRHLGYKIQQIWSKLI